MIGPTVNVSVFTCGLRGRSEGHGRHGDREKADHRAHRKHASEGYTLGVSWPWIVLLAIGIGVVVAAEWPRFERLAGADARRARDREKRKAKLTRDLVRR